MRDQRWFGLGSRRCVKFVRKALGDVRGTRSLFRQVLAWVILLT